MYPERFAKFFLISFHVLIVNLDGTGSQVQISLPGAGDWLQAANDELNREIKLQQEMMKKHAEDLWSIHKGETPRPRPDGTTTTSKPHDVQFTVVTPKAEKPEITATQPPAVRRPQPIDNDIYVDLRSPCLPTKTEVSERKEDGTWMRRKVCRGDVFFNDDFSNGPQIDNRKWSHEVKMPWSNGYGFVIYQESIRNSYVKDGVLFIKPTVLDDRTAREGYRYLENCTGEQYTQECEKQAKSFEILPPVETALMTTKNTMTFKYGRIEIRAKLPMGDWIVPEIKLEPKDKRTPYGRQHAGLIQLASARGNRRLMYDTNDIGNNHLEMGFQIGSNPPRTTSNTNPDGWGSGFHNYTLIWTPDNLKFQVDDKPAVPLCPQGRRLYEALGIEITGDKKSEWDKGSNIAPFDKEFYITLGLSVGGLKHFPDASRSSGQQKPWGDQKAKALYTFWVNRGQWLGSWEQNNGKDSALEIDYVRISAVE